MAGSRRGRASWLASVEQSGRVGSASCTLPSAVASAGDGVRGGGAVARGGEAKPSSGPHKLLSLLRESSGPGRLGVVDVEGAVSAVEAPGRSPPQRGWGDVVGCCLAPRRRRPEDAPPPVPTQSKCCKKMLRHGGSPSKVLLFPEEGWARSASSSYWTLSPAWWSHSRCKVVEVAGTRRHSTQAKMVDNGTGTLFIVGSFKRMVTDPDFKLYLTSNVTNSDFNMGYSMTGTLERGSKEANSFQMTHFAVIRRGDKP